MSVILQEATRFSWLLLEQRLRSHEQARRYTIPLSILLILGTTRVIFSKNSVNSVTILSSVQQRRRGIMLDEPSGDFTPTSGEVYRSFKSNLGPCLVFNHCG
ncbi:hypothetical protein EV421DRAFT_2018292 [Armillaria borealis]|uniref:Uncharacterized protein n=1 Tax=Armillaria borealis TaxID=47425 RepID=A0AA39MSJ8_9AGAR|nr:hypothetical protein EV421DRAFT_2018292 [Armillaria borealis]